MSKSEIVKIRLRPIVKHKFDEIAAREERSTAEVIRLALDYYLDTLPQRKYVPHITGRVSENGSRGKVRYL